MWMKAFQNSPGQQDDMGLPKRETPHAPHNFVCIQIRHAAGFKMGLAFIFCSSSVSSRTTDTSGPLNFSLPTNAHDQ